MCSKIDPRFQCRHLNLRTNLPDYTWPICRLGVPRWTKYHYRRPGEKGIEKNTAFYLCSQFLRCNMHWPKANCCQRMHVSPWKHWLLHRSHGKTSNWWVPKQPKVTYCNCRGTSSYRLLFSLVYFSWPTLPENISCFCFEVYLLNIGFKWVV